MNYLALGLQFHKTQKKKNHELYVVQPYFVHFSSLNSATAVSWTHPDQSLSLHSTDYIQKMWSRVLQKSASYLMLKNKTPFIQNLRGLFLLEVIKDYLSGREFQYFSFR